MRRLLAAALLLLLVACEPPAFQPQDAPLEGVTFEVQQAASDDGEALTTVRIEAQPPLTRAFLRFPGDDLHLHSEVDGCEVTAGAVECLLREVESAEVVVHGTVRLPDGAPLGVACRDECAALHADAAVGP